MPSTPSVVLVHGFWHGAWCWTQVGQRLAGRGIASAAVDQLGHGLLAPRPEASYRRPFDPRRFATEVSPNAHVTLEAAGDQLIGDLERIAASKPILLVAHSMGGTVATNAAQRRPDLVRGLVYVTAFMPGSGQPAVAYAQSPENEGELVLPHLVADPQAIGALRLDVGSDDAAYLDGLRRTFFGDLEDAVASAALRLLSPDAPAGVAAGATELTRDGWGSIPRSYVRCSEDLAIRPALQDRMMAEADAAFPDAPTTVHRLKASHSPFLSQPGAVAEIIELALHA